MNVLVTEPGNGMMLNFRSPILERKDLITEIIKVRKGGSSVVLANGCFDLFHVGHIRYLTGAKALGGILVVGLNSDKQVRTLKGPGRPFLPENERAEIVSAIRCVDLVTVFDEPTAEELIRAIKPDFHAKGTDYTTESVPERNVVRECGGKVAIVGDSKNHSSSEILKTIGSLRTTPESF